MQTLNPYQSSTIHETTARSVWSRWHFPLLLAWGILPTAFTLRSIYFAVENFNVHGRFYFGLIWDGLFVYVVLAMWIICVSLFGNRSSAVRLVRAVSIIPALPIAMIAMVSIVRHLLPGGTFYIPSVISRNGINEFLLYHLFYVIVFVPMAVYSFMTLWYTYRILRAGDSKHPLNYNDDSTNQRLHPSGGSGVLPNQ